MSSVPEQHRLVTSGRRQPVVAVSLLGSFELRVDASPVSLPAGTQRLIARLALRGRTGRSRLAGSLWPETIEHRALASLRTGIWRINQAAPGLVVAAHGQVYLRPDTDVDAQRLVMSARRLLDVGSDLPREELEVSVDDAELLPDWDDEWLATDRERLRQLRLHVFESMAQRLADAGFHGLALESALAAVRADPLRESAYRAVIRIHLAEGNVAEARRAYAECAAVLERDVGVAPSFSIDGLVPAHSAL